MGKREIVGSLELNPEKLFLSDAIAAAMRQPPVFASGFRGAVGWGIVSSETSVATGMASAGCMYPSVTSVL